MDLKSPPETISAPTQPHPTLGEAAKVWLKIGLLSFGGPAGQIALMHQELIERRRWISEKRFVHALNYCMLLPGPEAQQLAIYVGWLLHRSLGGIIAGALFVVPGALLLWAIAFVYVRWGDVPLMGAIFYGLKPAVMAIVAFAVYRIGRKILKNPAMWAIAAAAFVGIFFLGLPFPLIILAAGALGLLGGRFLPGQFLLQTGHAAGGTDAGYLEPVAQMPSTRRTALTATLCLTAWFLPVLLVGVFFGRDHTLFQEGLFFSKAAVVTFGGAYAVLPYVAQQAVEVHQWLAPGQMLDGLGLAETTPGPLILVLQFVGFLGGWHNPGELSPLAAASLGAFITSWTTFVPGFLFIFVGAPYIERLHGQKFLNTALSAITAAVVGVILNLAIWFSFNVLFPNGGTPDWFATLLFAAALVALIRFKTNVMLLIGVSALAGVAAHLLGMSI
jgi:chromate transporter